MTKSGLIDAIHGKSSNLTKVQVAHVVDTIVDSIKSPMMKGKKVEIRGFGNFKTRTRGIRKARNPRTGEVEAFTSDHHFEQAGFVRMLK
jgi:nucleoid DNA-binding protein